MKFEMIKIRTWNGVEEHPVWRFKDFAVREFLTEPGCEIIHVPSGMSIPARFVDRDHASRVMTEIQNLRSDWGRVSIADMTPLMGQMIRRIVQAHHGVWMPIPNQGFQNIAAKVYDTDLNKNDLV